MAKKYKSTKMLKTQVKQTIKPSSAFGSHANRLADSRKKKIQKLSQTQKRVMQSKKNNKMIKISKKAKKFALLDQQDQQIQQNYLDLKDFDDVNFNESDLQNDEQFDQVHDKLNFAGFEVDDNLLQQKKPSENTEQAKQKTKSQIYKQIIQKSKAYKLFRQQIYEQNLQKAKQLDNNFSELAKQLKFRNQDKKIQDKIQGRDLQYDRLMNELKDDERIVSNKIVQRKQKDTEKIRKKNQQLNKIMKDSDGEQQDIRGWVDGNVNDSQQSEENYSEDNLSDNQNQQKQSYDQLDDVNLSSSQEEQQRQSNQQNQDGQQQIVIDDDNQEQLEQVGEQQVGSDQEQQYQDREDDQQQDDQNQDQDSQDQQEQSTPPKFINKNGKLNNNNINKQQRATQNNKNNRPTPSHPVNQGAKKRKLNTIY